MNIEISNETISLFFKRLSKLFITFFPGIVILELFFNIGLFSKSPATLIEFALYLFWSGIFSLLYYIDLPNNIRSLEENIRKELENKYNLKPKKFEIKSRSETNIEDEIFLEFILFKLIITFLLYYLLLFIPIISILGIPIIILRLILILIIMHILSYLISYPFTKIHIWSIMKTAEKKLDKKD